MPASASLASKASAVARGAFAGSRPAKAAPARKPAVSKSPSHKLLPTLPAFARQASPAASSAGASHSAATTAKLAAPAASTHHAAKKVPPKPRPRLTPLAPSKIPGAGGQPLAPHVKEAVENTLLVDLGSVRLHSDAAAHDKAQSLSARAFTFGNHIFLGKGEQPADLALVSHEAAHVVQQQSGAQVQAWSASRTDRFEREADQAATAVARHETFAVRERVESPRVQRLGISDALDYFANKAYNIPGYRMFTIVLGVNPINMEHVNRTPANVFRAVVEFIPGGHLITQALDKYGVFDKVGKWVQKQLDTLAMTGSSIKKALMAFLHSLSWSDIFHLGSVWDRAKRIFTDPIDHIKKFVAGFLEGIWKFVRDAILKPIAALASKTAGWDLLCAVLGHNPITHEAVPRTPDNLIGGFMKLVHEEEVWNNLKRAKAVPRAWKWFQSVLSGALGFVSQIPSLFVKALKSLTWTDVINLPAGFLKIAGVFGKFLIHFVSWAGQKVWSLLQIIFEVVAPALMPYLRKLRKAFSSIIRSPFHFMHNLIAAGKLGIHNFAVHFVAHLKHSLLDWLTGSLPGVYIPKAFSLAEFGKFALSVFGISWAQIRAKIVKALGPRGETIMRALEKTFNVIVALVTGGPAAVWNLIKQQLSNLKDMVIDGIVGFVTDTIVKKAIPKLIAMFIPGAGFISAIVSIYDTIMVFVHKLAKIIQVVKAFLDSMMQIAKGVIKIAAAKVESALAGALSLVISFLAGFLGLGNIAAKIRGVIEKVRAYVDKGLDTAIGWIVGKAKSLFARLFGKKEDDRHVDPEKQKKIDAGIAALKAKEQASPSVQKDGRITHEDAQAAAAQIRSEHPVFKSITVTDGGDSWNFTYKASPEKTIHGFSKEESVEIAKVKAVFKKGYFSRADIEPILGLKKTAALTRLTKWREAGQVFVYGSALSDMGTQYTFDAQAAGYRPTNPNNRQKYGYQNPAKTSSVGLIILSKKFDPRTPKPIEAASVEYHTTLARYDSAKPGSSYKDFKFPVAILGHKENMGASDHWNKIGHKQTKAQNQAWNRNPDNYQGPEHETESAKSGGSSARYEAPSKDRGSDPSWYS